VGLLERAPAVVDEFLGVTDRKFGAPHAPSFVVDPALVTTVGGRGGVAAPQGAGQGRSMYGAGPAAVAGLLILAVPGVGGKPDLDADFGVARRARQSLDLATGRQCDLGPARDGRNGGVDRTGLHEGRRNDFDARQLETF